MSTPNSIFFDNWLISFLIDFSKKLPQYLSCPVIAQLKKTKIKKQKKKKNREYRKQELKIKKSTKNDIWFSFFHVFSRFHNKQVYTCYQLYGQAHNLRTVFHFWLFSKYVSGLDNCLISTYMQIRQLLCLMHQNFPLHCYKVLKQNANDLFLLTRNVRLYV